MPPRRYAESLMGESFERGERLYIRSRHGGLLMLGALLRALLRQTEQFATANFNNTATTSRLFAEETLPLELSHY